MRVAATIVLSPEERSMLTRLARSNTTSVRLARRAQIVLFAAEGMDNTQIAERLRTGRVQVGRWRERYARRGMVGIERDLPRGGRKPTVGCCRNRSPDHANQAASGHSLEYT